MERDQWAGHWIEEGRNFLKLTKSKILWLKGDQNAAFFHSLVVHKGNKNALTKLKDHEGVWKQGREAVSQITAISYFEELFQSSFPTNIDQELIGDCLEEWTVGWRGMDL